MPYQFRDLIVTLVPWGPLGGLEAGDGGDSGGGCTSSCVGVGGFDCGDSGEIIEFAPFAGIDPAFQMELRQLLIFGLTASGVALPEPTRGEVLNEQMRPKTREEAEDLERRLSSALMELREYKETLGER
jgi:hypothetical protein